MAYLELDDIIENIQKFGGATTYWHELTSRLPEFVDGAIVHTSGHRFARLYSPPSTAKVFHSSHFRVSSTPTTRNVTTIHDLIYEKGMAGGRGKIVNLYERRKSVKRADAIICISESTRRDLLECYGRELGDVPVHVIHHGCTRLQSNPEQQARVLADPRYSELCLRDKPFFLFVGGRGGYKNFDALLLAFAQGGLVQQGIGIICTGAAFTAQEQQRIEALGLGAAVHSIGFVDMNTIGALYSVARALVYPSAYEGFGLPPLEAMAAGCPVICANSSSLPEVVGDSGILVDPHSPDGLAVALASLLDDERRTFYANAGLARSSLFDWRESAKKHAAVYASL